MKKIIAFLLVLTLSLGLLAGCAPADNTTAGPTLAEAVDALTSSYSGDEGKMTPADYKLVSRIVVRTVAFEVTWAASLDSIQITKTEDGKYWVVDVPSKNETQVEYTLTATVKDADGKTETKTFTRVLPVYDDAGIVSEPVEGQAYKFFMVHANLGKTLFATTATQKSNNQDKYIKTDIDPKKGADFFAEKVEGGYKFYTTIDGNKMYMHAFLVENDDGNFSKHIGYAAESNCVYVYNKELKTWFVTLNNFDYGVGTYNTYDTVCISESTHFTADAIGVKQFTLNLMDKEAAEELAPTEGPADPTELTSITDFTAIAEALENKTSTVEKYLVKGVIVEIKNTTFGNLYIQDEAGNKLYIYGVHSKDGETRFDAMDPQPKVGDTVTLMGIAKNYNGAQMENGWVQELIPGEGGNEGGGNEGGDTTKTPAEIVDAAYALGANEKLEGQTLTGKITSIDTAYSEQYKNITVTIVIEGKEDKPIVCFRMKGEGAENLAVGDVITVTGDLINYVKDGAETGTIEFNAGCTFTKAQAAMTPAEIVDAAYALGANEKLEGQTLTGKITSIDTAYSEQYKNITVTIVIEGKEDKPIVCFRMKGEGAENLAVGDVITVTGDLINYVKDGAETGTIEFNAGCTFVLANGGNEGGETETFTAETGKLNVVLGEDKQYIVALDGGWVTATTNEAEAGAVVIEFNADKTQAKIKVGGKYIAPSGGNKNGIKEGEYVWAVVKNADGTYRFMGQGSDTVTLAFNTDSKYMKFRAYKNETIEKAPDAYPCDFTFTTK